MNAFEKIIHFLQYEVEVPKLYGTFHIVSLILVLIAAVILATHVNKGGDRAYRTTLFVLWVIIVVFEVMREFVFSMHVSDGVATWDYAWYIFPFQLCASPLYIFPFAALMPEGRVRRACMMYLSTFALFGGLVVMIYPGDVVTYLLSINIQALLHHGIQLIGGIITIVHNREHHTFKNMYKGVIVFAVLVGIAMVLNVGVHSYLEANGMGDTFNMFFISPYFDCTLPVLGIFDELVPYPVFLVIYIVGFIFLSGVIFLGTKYFFVYKNLLFISKKASASK